MGSSRIQQMLILEQWRMLNLQKLGSLKRIYIMILFQNIRMKWAELIEIMIDDNFFRMSVKPN